MRYDYLRVSLQPGLDAAGLPLPEDDVPLAIAAADPLAVGREAYLAGVARDGVPGETLVSRLSEVVRAVHQNLVVQRLRGKVLLCQEKVDRLLQHAWAKKTYYSGAT